LSDGSHPKSADGQPVAPEARDPSGDGRRFSPSIARNRDVVRDTFLAHMPHRGRILEVASGTGEHGVHILKSAPELTWIHSDVDFEARLSQAAWQRACADLDLEGPMHLDMTDAHWPARVKGEIAGIFCTNMIHIAPFAATRGLFRGAGERLVPGQRLFLYGPFSRNGEMAESNRSFDASLKSRDPDWGVRDLETEILSIASGAGLALKAVIEMPANNLSVIFERA